MATLSHGGHALERAVEYAVDAAETVRDELCAFHSSLLDEVLGE